MGRRTFILAVAMLVVAGSGAALTLFLMRRERPYDPAFDTRVGRPAHPGGGGPLVLYDEGHLNTHTADSAYRPFVELVRSDGFEVSVVREPFTADLLATAAVLVVVAPRGVNETNDDPAFTRAEIAVVHDWVEGGGALLLVTDHWPFGAAAESLGRAFGVEMGKGLVEDPGHSDPERGASHLVFDRENGLLRDHPIVRGGDPEEAVRRVLTFTGQSLAGPPGSTAFLALSDAAIEYPPTTPSVARDGGDLRVSMEYGQPVPAAGRAQGLAFEPGEGRVVVLGEAGMLRAQRLADSGAVGMSHPGYDNRRLALNAMRWLARAL
ncbi:MAG TPA: DUF4350 domain-containing protein [Thermoanaerobaculia bacterium]|nr:DUF4350 domain-containing protein [Thermoanaerobaculia bacterium]